MTLGEQHQFKQVPLTPDELKAAGYSRNQYMPPYRLHCSCGFVSGRVSQGQGEWETVNQIRTLHLLESLPGIAVAAATV